MIVNVPTEKLKGGMISGTESAGYLLPPIGPKGSHGYVLVVYAQKYYIDHPENHNLLPRRLQFDVIGFAKRNNFKTPIAATYFTTTLVKLDSEPSVDDCKALGDCKDKPTYLISIKAIRAVATSCCHTLLTVLCKYIQILSTILDPADE